MPFVPIIADVELAAEEDRGQLGASESELVDTQSFRKCHISTVLNDLVPCQFINGRNGKKREACVVFLQFNFGPQKQGSDQRITAMLVEVNVEEADEGNPELEIKGRYPISAHGPVEVVNVSSTRGIALEPNVNGVSVASITAEVGRKYNMPSSASLVSSPAGDMGVRWQLQENNIYKDGVPAVVNCAFALQTDGLPFEIEVLFSGQCPLLGVFRLKGKAVVKIGKDLLWMRTPREDVSVSGLNDIDSKAFKEWVKTKTHNSWAERVEYED